MQLVVHQMQFFALLGGKYLSNFYHRIELELGHFGFERSDFAGQILGLGLTLGEMFHLEELAADCRTDGVYEFLFVAQPLRITGAVGSPINPLAVK